MLDRRCLFVGLFLIGALLTGCQNSGPTRVAVYKTKGKVTYLGNPVIGAVVTFSPQDKQPVAIGRTNDAGEFALTTYGASDGAAAGEYKVLVMLTDTSSDAAAAPASSHDTDQPGGGHSGAAAKKRMGGSLLPAKFADPTQTPLTAKVEAGGANDFPLDLK